MLRALYRRFFPAKAIPNPKQWLEFSSYEDAANASVGYEIPEVLDVTLNLAKFHIQNYAKKKISREIPNDRLHFQNAFIFQKISQELGYNFSVYEIGGAYGSWNLIINTILPEFKGNWIIRETKGVVEKDKSGLAIEERKLSFVSSNDEFSKLNSNRDVLFCQGSIQYLPNSEEEIKWISKSNFKYVYFTRTPLLDSEINPKYLVQKHYLKDYASEITPKELEKMLISVPSTILSQKKFLSYFEENYEVEMIVHETESSLIPVLNSTTSSTVYSILFKLK